MPRKSLWPYLLINIIVSACVTAAVLLVYDRYFKPDCGTGTPPISSLATTPQAGEIRMEFVSIIGAGTAESEITVIKNDGVDAVTMNGWILRDQNGNVYTFPQLELNPNAAVQVHTIAGTDTAIDLFWGCTAPVWESGEVASLFDAQGILRAVYTIP